VTVNCDNYFQYELIFAVSDRLGMYAGVENYVDFDLTEPARIWSHHKFNESMHSVDGQ